MVCPVGELIECHCRRDSGTEVTIAGESKAMAYIRKTQAVDLLWLRDILRHMRLRPEKIASEKNVADAWTKAISEATLERLLPLLGRH